MKNIIFILVTCLLLVITYCSSTESIADQNDNIMQNGWIDANTFQTIGIGVSPASETHAFTQQDLACKAAKINAQEKMIEQLGHGNSKYVKGTVSIEKRGEKTYIKEVQGYIRMADIVKRVYDKENKKCTVVLQLKEENLKSKIENIIK